MKQQDEARGGGASRSRASTAPSLAGRTRTNPDATRRSSLVKSSKSRDEAVGSEKGSEVGRCRNLPPAAEKLAGTRRLVRSVMDPDGRKKELEEKVEFCEGRIKNLEEELQRAQSLNMELQSQNQKLSDDLSAAESKIASLTSPQQKDSNGQYQRPNFKDIQKLIANKLENPKLKKDVCIVKISPPPALPSPRMLATVDVERKAPSPNSLQPPPPPPLPPRSPAPRKATSFQEFYQSLTKQEGRKAPAPAPLGPGSRNKPGTTSAHNSIVGEIQNRSAYLLAIKADIATRGEFVNGLIQKVQAAAYASIEDVLKFVDWLDTELSSLADERAVLKHFKWPERKADAMREAAIEYRDLKLLENEMSAFQDDTNLSCGVAFKRMATLLDKSERSIQRLIKLRSSVMRSYQECKIPTDWMLDSGIVSKIKKASMKLAKVYMKRVTMELESIQNSERESGRESLLLQGLHFAYRAHQFAGGLDSETMCAFEEIRQRVPGHLGGSREPLSAITTS